MASFRIHNDQNAMIQPAKGKENAPAQKRTVLGVRNCNVENGGGINQKDNAVKKGLSVRQKEVIGCSYPHQNGLKIKSKTFGESQINENVKKEVTLPCEEAGQVIVAESPSEVVCVKQENKSRALKDKPVENGRPSTSKHFEFPECVTALHRAPVVCSTYSEELMSEGDYALDSPMCLDTSKGDSCNKKQFASSSTQLTLNERLFSCQEYRTEIMLYLRSLQLEHRPKKNYMLKQTDITYAMRAILVDWLVEVVEEYHMKTETLYLAVSYIDRFLSYMSVVKTKLQLVGAAAMFIASKFEEIYPPGVKEFVFITDDTYTKKQVLRMEHLILKVLSFDLSTPTALCFLTNYSTNYPTPDTVTHLAMYLLELTLMEADPYLGFLPSEIAASALCVARYTLMTDEVVFPDKLQEVVDHHIEDLLPCIRALDRTFKCAETCPQKAIQEKYKSDMFGRVSTIQPLNEDCHTVLNHYSNIDTVCR